MLSDASWPVGLVANAVVLAAYLGVGMAVLVPLGRSRQLRSNPLGVATAAIFLTGAVHHGALALGLLLPSLGVGDGAGEATRTAFGWPLVAVDVVAMATAAYYWALRRRHGAAPHGAQLFWDLRQREQQALELNDTVLQGLVVAKMALDLEQPAKANEALTASIASASRMITELLGSQQHSLDLQRSVPAAVRPIPEPAPEPAPAPVTEAGR